MWLVSLADDEDDDILKMESLVGLKCCWDSVNEWDGDDDLKLKFVLLNGDRCWCCFGDGSSRDVAIFVVVCFLYTLLLGIVN